MSVREPDLVAEFALCLKTHSQKLPAEITAEVTDLLAALAADTTTSDQRIQAPAAGSALNLGKVNGLAAPTAGWKTRFGNDMILLINQGKAGGLTNAQVIGAINNVRALVNKPVVIDVPYAYLTTAPPAAIGSIVSCTLGNWDGVPVSYTYQWKRDGVTNIGTTNSPTAPYTLIAADIGGHALTCTVTATNAQGSTVAPASNIIFT
jgi:hypothetical protein